MMHDPFQIRNSSTWGNAFFHLGERTQRYQRKENRYVPSKDFLPDCVDLRKGITVIERGQSLAAYYRIELRPGLALNFGEQDCHEKEGAYGRDELKMRLVRAQSISRMRGCTMSAAPTKCVRTRKIRSGTKHTGIGMRKPTL